MITEKELRDNEQVVISETGRYKLAVFRTQTMYLNTLGFDNWTVMIKDKDRPLNSGFMYKDTYAGAIDLARDYANQMSYPQMEEWKEKKE